MLLYGASGHAKVIIDCLLATGESIAAIFDDDAEKKPLLGIEIIHNYSEIYRRDQRLIISIGDNGIRRKIAGIVRHSFGQVVHPSAQVSERASIGEGTVVFHNAVVQTGSVIGDHVIINTAASVDHDCRVGDFVHIAPNATLTGGITVGEGTMIGAGAVIVPNVKIGKWAVIGAGSIIRKDVPDYALVADNPARVVKIRK